MKPILISEGDPTGISYEILDKCFDELKKISKTRKVFLVSSQDKIKSKFEKEFLPMEENYFLQTGLFIHRETKFKNEKFELGKPSIHSGKASYHSLKESIQLQKLFDANLITLPLSKEWVIKSGIKNFTGHTEELARSYKKNTFMLMYGKEFSVIPLTTHIPLQKVSKELRKIKWKFLFDSILKSKLYKQPKIALCGLNPHAGENGKVGREEVEILKPILKKYTSKLYTFTGPYSADTIFCEGIREKFDIILSCYHDQGLIPFKSIIAEKGINLTLGLDFIRVSPDHGTAFDIAGKNLASEQSLKECISLLAKL